MNTVAILYIEHQRSSISNIRLVDNKLISAFFHLSFSSKCPFRWNTHLITTDDHSYYKIHHTSLAGNRNVKYVYYYHNTKAELFKSYNSNLSLAFLVYKKHEIQYTFEPCYKLMLCIRCLAANHCYHTSIQIYNIKYGCSSAIFWLKSALSSNFLLF